MPRSFALPPAEKLGRGSHVIAPLLLGLLGRLLFLNALHLGLEQGTRRLVSTGASTTIFRVHLPVCVGKANAQGFRAKITKQSRLGATSLVPPLLRKRFLPLLVLLLLFRLGGLLGCCVRLLGCCVRFRLCVKSRFLLLLECGLREGIL